MSRREVAMFKSEASSLKVGDSLLTPRGTVEDIEKMDTSSYDLGTGVEKAIHIVTHAGSGYCFRATDEVIVIV